ncbi:FliH/SctL family protein [Teredinibacter sp. KSP-S5-2]|uniref:FliH/SctL family protein n=1 Tax=Teredinibacter sp. KSP-S5-2 TaxID=3034506 RepID=UPI0029350C95|nr:FliH/SctL family protein [Teredinibacter sp. KSP-S5-2]WNO11338.1 FliH/SctL family protein [Teredinibacter sp. KSP-S5-2]
MNKLIKSAKILGSVRILPHSTTTSRVDVSTEIKLDQTNIETHSSTQKTGKLKHNNKETKSNEDKLLKIRGEMESDFLNKIDSIERKHHRELNELKASVNNELEVLSILKKELERYKAGFKQEMEEALVLLTNECLVKLISEDNVYNSVVEKITKKEINNLADTNELTLCVSEKEISLFEKIACKIDGNIKIISDSTVKLGECRIDSAYSSKEVGINTILSQLQTSLITTLREKSGEEE